jgi:D-alanyl-D-alanine endopeptidase (penicillin-binding protein 7)
MKKILICLSLVFLVSGLYAQPSYSRPESGNHSRLSDFDPTNIQLASLSATVVDVKSGISLFNKNSEIVMPIASITKLMTAMVVLDANLPLDEKITFSRKDRERMYNNYSRIRNGSRLSRRDMLRLMLMSSENLAAATLGGNYPGGYSEFVKAMNNKARTLGMTKTRFVDTSGLSAENVSTASDLVKMVRAACKYEQIHEYTTTSRFQASFQKPRYKLQYINTNALVRAGKWDINLSKTGYLNKAGRCLVMLTEVDDQQVIMVMLDSFGKRTPIGDANRIKKWMQTGHSGKVARAARNYERNKIKKYSNQLVQR